MKSSSSDPVVVVQFLYRSVHARSMTIERHDFPTNGDVHWLPLAASVL